MQTVAKRLILAEKILNLRSVEASDCLELIVKELHGHLENLKGDYLKQIIISVKANEQKIKTC